MSRTLEEDVHELVIKDKLTRNKTIEEIKGLYKTNKINGLCAPSYLVHSMCGTKECCGGCTKRG